MIIRDMEEMESSGNSRRRSDVKEAKPKKLDMSKQNFLERAKQEEAEKIAEERRRRLEEDRKLRENSDLHLADDREVFYMILIFCYKINVFFILQNFESISTVRTA